MCNTDSPAPDRVIQIPYRIRMDGWWLVDDLQIPCKGPRRAAGCTFSLIPGDFLTFEQAPGLNLFAYAIAVAMGILCVGMGRLPARAVTIALGLSLVAAVPVLEAPTIVGVLLAMLGLAMLALASAGMVPVDFTILPGTLLRFALIAPLRLIEDGGRLLSRAIGLRLARSALVWVLPIAFALLFLVLFWSANPVIADVLGKLDLGGMFSSIDPVRMGFWLMLAALLWPVLVPRLKRWRKAVPTANTVSAEPRENLLFGPAAILRSLIVFNALFAIETAIDLTYLWGGVALPDGMTRAEFAHRGAYPLIVTALLAAAFVLAAMRRNGPGETHKLIRWLVYAWIGQNILLCVSAILRLKLYVEIFSLTELRLAAGIWMGLVAVGLALIQLRIMLRQSNAWLIAVNLAALMVTLYGCALIDFSALIARFNVEHSLEVSGEGTPLDVGYFNELGPTAIPALDSYIEATADRHGPALDGAREVRHGLATAFTQRSGDWRSWSYRDWRLEQYLRGHSLVER
jgi:hypothetical protein